MKRILLFTISCIVSCFSYAQDCSAPLKIVVLGSSTAWGNGVPVRDSAWTFKFGRYLKANHNTADTVINLANGGYTTHQIMPTGTPSYTVLGNTFNVDANKNITKAISLAPSAIIINISNDDEGRGFPLSVQIANYLALKQAAAAANIPLWVATTQPRDNLGTTGSAHLKQMADSITYYFGDKAIDFWTGLANATNTIATAYAAGDGFHFNSAGQNILFQRVVAENIPQVVCTPTVIPAFQLSSFVLFKVKDSLQLRWSTSKENKSKWFAAEKSADSLTWSTIAQINAMGNSNATTNYTVTDSAMSQVLMYYRLKMIDSADNYTYSQAIKGMRDTAYNTPFRLFSFSLTPQPGKIQLNWSTLQENNSLSFSIERSTDSSNWAGIGTIAAAGSSAALRNYTYTDNNVTPDQRYFYRLNMLASDNRNYYSLVVKGAAPNVPASCSNPIRIVVLGSSTAWGNGVPSRDSAWTFKFARYLKTYHNAADTVINLAVGGYTTQQIQATGTPSYTVLGNTYTVDVNKNITKAISLAPNAIIINISNDDEGRGFPVSVQAANYLALKQAAANANIPLWVATTQPRDNLGTAGATHLRQMADSINLFFGDKAIDFWTGLASATNTIATAYAAGDGFHFNSAGQEILFQRVVAEQIPQVLCIPATTPAFQLTSFAVNQLKDSLQLQWTTASETKSKWFIAEQSTDSLSWTTLQQINAAGNSTSTRTYAFTDPVKSVTPKYYRLNMVDSADQHTYSNGVRGIPDTLYYSPFRLTALSITSLAGKIRLDWTTLLESKTLTFTIERSTDSSTWSSAGSVSAAGSSNSSRTYTYTDNSVVAEQNYFYRLKMTATESRISYSSVVQGKATAVQGNCNDPIRIVVLGSSTAWGDGLPSRDSAWTFRYARYLKANHNAADTVINLAIGGYTTQQAMPTGTPPYTSLGITQYVDTEHNITKALSLNPDAIIINMPTNDEAKGFPLDKQTANFLALKQAAQNANIPLWVTTTQPRGNLGFDAAIRLRQMKDTIIKYFGGHTIDFYTGMATSAGFIDPLYNSGDDVHFNSPGQSILFSRVVAAAIPDSLCANQLAPLSRAAATAVVPQTTGQSFVNCLLYPNPASDYVYLQGIREAVFKVEVYNSSGALVYIQQQSATNRIDIRTWRAGIYFVVVNSKQRYKLVKIQ